MVSERPQELPIGERLLDTGWQQGTIFAAPTLSIVHQKLDEGGRVITKSRSSRNDERFVLVSQDCDIKSKDEPYVEAILCTVVNESFISRLIDAKSARWFAVDENSRLVAQAKYRILIDKEMLLTFVPEPWPSSPERHSRFVTWLGRRYDRPALADEMVEALQKPIERTLAQLSREQPDLLALFSQAVHEVRVTLPWTEQPPYAMHLVLMVRSTGVSAEQADAIEAIVEEMHASVDTSYIHLDTRRLVTEDEISLRDYRATIPLFLDYLTYQGDEVERAEPLRPY